MDIKSAVDNAEYMGENGRGDGSPKFKNNNNQRQQSTIIPHSEYKDYVPELVDWKKFIKAIERGNTTQVALLVDDAKIRVTQVRDDRGFTLLHHSVLKMKHEMVRFFIDYAQKKEDEDEDIILDWINAKSTKEKFTCLHFAAFKGCLKSAQILIENGADMKIVNAFGLTVMHLAC